MLDKESQSSNALKAVFDKLLKPHRYTQPTADFKVSRTIPSYPNEPIDVTVTFPASDSLLVDAVATTIQEGTSYSVKTSLDSIVISDPFQHGAPEDVIETLYRRLDVDRLSIYMADYFADQEAVP